MSLPEVIAFILVGLGLLAGAFIAAQRPAFWLEFALRILKALLPYLTVVYLRLAKRMDPAQEKAMHDCARRGGEWNHILRRCK